MESSFSIGAIARWINAPEASLADKLLRKFRSLKENYLYSDVMLVDLEGHARFSLSGYRGPLTGDDQKAMAKALAERRPVLTDLHRGLVDSSPHIDVIAPLFAQMDDVSEPVGAIMLKSDARQFLYPFIMSWPASSRSAETLLVRQIVSGLLRLQAQHVEDNRVREILNESQSRIRSMALIHEKLYQSQDFARIYFFDYISKMVTHLFAMFSLPSSKVRFAVEAENIQLDINRAIACGLIINELVTNALKHAFPGEKKGELTVRMKREEGEHYRLSVKDTGVGLPEGFDPEKQKTLGFQIVHDLVRQLNGSTEFRREEGTEIIIGF